MIGVSGVLDFVRNFAVISLMLVVGFALFWLVLTVISMAIMIPKLGRYAFPPDPLGFLLYPFFLADEYLPESVKTKIHGYMTKILERLAEWESFSIRDFWANRKKKKTEGKEVG